jgi:hypothetical protein
VYGLASFSFFPFQAGVNMRDVISMASGPETRMHPMAPPWAVAMAQMVSWFILSGLFLFSKDNGFFTKKRDGDSTYGLLS